MSEWQLFDPESPPEFVTATFFEHYPWIDPVWQPGFDGRIKLAAGIVAEQVAGNGLRTVTDLGCGDGSLLMRLRLAGITAWGYELGLGNVEVAQAKGLDVRHANFHEDKIEYGDLIVCTEVVEHLIDPRGFLRGLPGDHLVVSSPAFETDKNHYEHHAWAWDEEGYRAMVTDAGWTPGMQRTSDEGFQVLAASR